MVRCEVSVPCVIPWSGCWADKSTRVPLIVHATAMADMQSTTSMVAKRQLAARNCRIVGYRKRTETDYRCMKALIARDIQRTRGGADSGSRRPVRAVPQPRNPARRTLPGILKASVGLNPSAPRDEGRNAAALGFVIIAASADQASFFEDQSDNQVHAGPECGGKPELGLRLAPHQEIQTAVERMTHKSMQPAGAQRLVWRLSGIRKLCRPQTPPPVVSRKGSK